MKKVIYTFISISIIIIFSCEKDWLTVPAETKYNSSSVFNSVDKAEMAVMGCYRYTFGREMLYQLLMGSDVVMSTEINGNSKYQNANYVIDLNNAPEGTYQNLYAGIEYANSCIKGLESMNVSDNDEKDKIDQLLGESYAIRSMNYLNLIRYFGDVPFATKPIADLGGVFTSSRVSRDTIYDVIISDLQKATELMPWFSEGAVPTVERFTKNSAYGMLARVALYAAGYSLRWDLNTYAASSVKLAQRDDQTRVKELYKIAADACAEIINKGDNSLVSTYEDIFRDLAEKEYNSEGMLEVGQYGLNADHIWNGYTNGMYCDKKNPLYGKSLPQMQAMPNYYYEFEDGDTRRDIAIVNYSIDYEVTRILNTIDSRPIGKYRVTWKGEICNEDRKCAINWPVLRYADVLLMHAEALNEYNNGPTAAAIESYEKVRTRAFGNDPSKIGTTPADYAGFRAAIIQERKLELAFEGFRRTDLVRWGILYDTLMATKQHVIELANKQGRYANVGVYAAYKKEKATNFNDPVAAVPFTEYTNFPDTATLHSEGYTVIDLFGDAGIYFTLAFEPNSQWVQDLFYGLEFEKDELLPFNQTNIMDENIGLKGQQHPKYQ